jgi:hypothetical protein
MTHPIVLKTKEDIIKLSAAAAHADAGFTISYGSTIVDPRSVLALLTLLGKTALLVAPDHMRPELFTRFIKKISE